MRAQAPSQLPATSGFNQVAALRFAMIACGVLGIAVPGIGLYSSSHVSVERLPMRQNTGAERNLIRELQSLRAAWDPKQRRRILEQAKGFAPAFVPALQKILRTADHPLLGAAVEYSSATQDKSLRPALLRLIASRRSLPPELRAHAVTAANRLQPFALEELTKFLGKPNPSPVQVAALAICAERDDAPGERIFRLIHPDDPEQKVDAAVREAAVAAFPPRPEKHVLQELWILIQSGEPEACDLALRTLRRVAPNPDNAKTLSRELPRLEGAAIPSALELLTSWNAPIDNWRAIWAIAQRDDVSPHVRVLAMSYLERTKRFDRTIVQDALPGLDWEMRYAAARCLVLVGEAAGIQTLLDMVEQQENEDVAARTRRLLAWMTGLGPSSQRESFETALADKPFDTTRGLPPMAHAAPMR